MRVMHSVVIREKPPSKRCRIKSRVTFLSDTIHLMAGLLYSNHFSLKDHNAAFSLPSISIGQSAVKNISSVLIVVLNTPTESRQTTSERMKRKEREKERKKESV